MDKPMPVTVISLGTMCPAKEAFMEKAMQQQILMAFSIAHVLLSESDSGMSHHARHDHCAGRLGLLTCRNKLKRSSISILFLSNPSYPPLLVTAEGSKRLQQMS